MNTADYRYGENESGRKGMRILLPVLYAIAELAILVVLKKQDFTGGSVLLATALMYGAIVLNTAVLLILLLRHFARETKRERSLEEDQGLFGVMSRRSVFVSLGLLFTLAADTVLVLLDRWYLAGVILFCIVQTCYALSFGSGFRDWLLRIGNFLLVAAVLLVFRMGTPLNIASAYSITQLTLNALAAVILIFQARAEGETAEDHPGLLLFALGLILFWCCDVSVGIYNLTAGVPGFGTLCETSGFLMWVFYLPSQVLLVFSEMCFLREDSKPHTR